MSEDKEKVEPCTVPFNLQRTCKGWTWTCKFCDEEGTENWTYPGTAEREGMLHGKRKHYDWAADLFMDDEDLAKRREGRRRFKEIAGSGGEVDALNRYERGMGL